MIGDAVLGIAQQVLHWLSSFLPGGSITDMLGLVVPTGWLYGYSFLNVFLPVSEVLAAAAGLMALRGVVFTFKLALFVYHQFWGSS